MISTTSIASTTPTTSTTNPPTTTQVFVPTVESEVLEGFQRYVGARALGDGSGAAGAAAYRLREARSDSVLVPKWVRVKGIDATVEACSEGEERLVLLKQVGNVWSVEHVLTPVDGGWCR
jgi:hypothetical protein